MLKSVTMETVSCDMCGEVISERTDGRTTFHTPHWTKVQVNTNQRLDFCPICTSLLEDVFHKIKVAQKK